MTDDLWTNINPANHPTRSERRHAPGAAPARGPARLTPPPAPLRDPHPQPVLPPGELRDHALNRRLEQGLAAIAKQQRFGALLLVERADDTGVDHSLHGKLGVLSRQLRRHTRSSDLIAPLRDTRCIILIQEGGQPTAALNLCKRILGQFHCPPTQEPRPHPAGLRIGIRIVGPEHEGLAALVAEADWALTRARQQTDRAYHLYQAEDDRGLTVPPPRPKSGGTASRLPDTGLTDNELSATGLSDTGLADGDPA